MLPPPRCGLGLTGRWRDGQGDVARESLRPGVERDDREPARPRAPPTAAPSIPPTAFVSKDPTGSKNGTKSNYRTIAVQMSSMGTFSRGRKGYSG